MPEQDKKQNKNFEFSFFSELSEDTMIQGVYLTFKLLEYRHNPNATLDTIGAFFESNSNQKEVTKRLIGEIERVNGKNYQNLSEESVNAFIVDCSFSMLERITVNEDPEAKLRAQKTLRKLRSVKI